MNSVVGRTRRIVVYFEPGNVSVDSQNPCRTRTGRLPNTCPKRKLLYSSDIQSRLLLMNLIKTSHIYKVPSSGLQRLVIWKKFNA
jgi:hypothetical protein